jgi:hypothetical protein
VSRVGVPIEPAYTGAIDHPCPMCRAGIGDWCKDQHGRARRVPCVKRAVFSAVAIDSEPSDFQKEVTDLFSATIDFAEPRYPRD